MIANKKRIKRLEEISFNFRCVCDKCGEKFIRPTAYICENYFDKNKFKKKTCREVYYALSYLLKIC